MDGFIFFDDFSSNATTSITATKITTLRMITIGNHDFVESKMLELSVESKIFKLESEIVVIIVLSKVLFVSVDDNSNMLKLESWIAVLFVSVEFTNEDGCFCCMELGKEFVKSSRKRAL